MLFNNHLVNITQILEEETAMAQIRIHVLHCGKIGVAPNLPASAQWRWAAKAAARRRTNDARICRRIWWSTQRDCFWWMLDCRAL